MRLAAVAAVPLASALLALGWRAPQVASHAGEAQHVVFDGRLASGWQDWSWGKRDLNNRDRTYQGKPVIRFTPEGYGGLYLHQGGLNLRPYSQLLLRVHGGLLGGQKVSIGLVFPGNVFGPKFDLGTNTAEGRIPADRWTLAIVPIYRLGGSGKTITGVVVQDSLGAAQPSIYIADVRFTGVALPPASTCQITVDVRSGRTPISPLIYGMAGAGEEIIRDLRLPLVRAGGNPTSRFNWEKGNCWNAGRDWEFRNGNYNQNRPEDRRPSGTTDRMVAMHKRLGAQTLLTIPTLGYVARDDNNETRSLGVPPQGGPPVAEGSEAIAGYDPTANRARTSIRSFPRKKGGFTLPPDLTDDAVYQDEWVHHLVRKFGSAREGGVAYYAMDNEPDLWDITHTDVQPVSPDYGLLLSRFLDYANAVKDVDRSCMVTGPVSWGWTGYWHSPRDRGDLVRRPDRRAHGDMPFLAWFLKSVAEHDRRIGRRTLDVLDIHYYPQGDGIFAGKTDEQTNALRLRSVRSLWDPGYRDESWIGESIRLIPRMKEWISRYYPGTKLAITEWNFGADNTMNGALAIAETLGILGREGVHMACYWMHPPAGSPGYLVWKLYRNADAKGSGFGGTSVRAVCDAPDDVASFAALDGPKATTLVLINRRPRASIRAAIQIQGAQPSRAQGWRVAQGARSIETLSAREVARGRLQIALPPQSVTLLRFE